MPSPLVARVRAKYGEAYADLSDDELESRLLAKYPQYADMASPKGRMVAEVQAGTSRAMEGAKTRSDAPTGSFLGNMGEAATLESEGLPAQAKGSLVGGAAVLPFLAPARVAAGAFGGYEGYKRGGLPGAVAGMTAGALAPGPTFTGLAGVAGYEHGGLPGAVIGGTLGAVLPGVAAKAAGALKDLSLTARLAHALGREAPEAVAAAANLSPRAAALAKAGMTEGEADAIVADMAKKYGDRILPPGVPGPQQPIPVMAVPRMPVSGPTVPQAAQPMASPAIPSSAAAATVKMPALALAEDIQAQVAMLRGSGLSKAQIVAAIRETRQVPPETAEKMVDMITKAGGAPAATAEVLPTGTKTMATNLGGKAQPYMGPARVPESDADLETLLRQSLDAYRMK